MLISDFTESLDRILQLISIYGYMPQISLVDTITSAKQRAAGQLYTIMPHIRAAAYPCTGWAVSA